jgi:hypothetical protein
MMTNEMDLVRDYAARQSKPAFEALVTRYVSLVYSTALRQTGDPHPAGHVTPAVFIMLARKGVAFGQNHFHRCVCQRRDGRRFNLRFGQRSNETYGLD